ncbi:MAG: hypothetical protein WBG80_17180 [Bacteroidota bacterium]
MKVLDTSVRWLLLLVAAAVLIPFLIYRPHGPLLPEELKGLVLQKEISGENAKRIVDRMHGKAVAERENSIGYYGGSSGEATLYVTLYKTPGEASQVEKVMADRIAAGNPVFGHFRIIDVRERRVAICYGMGQTHFFFSRGRALYWLAVDNDLAHVTIQSLVRVLG